MTSQPDPDTEPFLAAWFARCPAGQYVEVRPLNKRRGCKPLRQTFATSLAEALAAIQASIQNQDDVYIGALPRRTPSGKASSVTALTWLWADIDYGTVGHASPAPYQTAHEAFDAICALPIAPTMVVDTGGGYHVWYALEREPSPTEWRDAISRLTHALHGDANAVDTPRILRVPGTANHKTDPPRPARFVSIDPDVAHPIAVFLALAEPPDSSPTSPPEYHPEPGTAPHPANPDRPFDRANEEPVAQVLDWLGVKMHREGARVYCACPVHGGKNTSQMQVGGDENIAYCYGDCRKAYSPVDLVAAVHRVTPREAVNLLAHRFNFDGFDARDAARDAARRERKPLRVVAPVATPAPASAAPTTQTTTPWTQELVYSEDAKGNKKLRRVVANAITILRRCDQWTGVLAYDEMRERPVKVKPPPWHGDDAPLDSETRDVTSADITRTVAWLSRVWGLDLTPPTIADAIDSVARANRIHPIRDYLDGLVWDGTPRCNTWLARYLGAKDTDYTRAIGARFLLAAVARVYEPGCKVDNVPVLEGLQGRGKSTVARILAVNPEWFFDSDLPIGDKDAPQALAGKWIVELGELHALSRAAITVVKQFVSRQIDTYRPSFGRVAADYPRRWVAIGTTNADAYLTDPTGNRRWWPVETSEIDLAGLRADVGQLWAEARTRYEQREAWHVDSAELATLCASEQEARLQADPWDEVIGSWLLEPTRAVEFARVGYVTTAQVLAGALRLEIGRTERRDEMRVGECLTRLGWRKGKQRRVSGARVWPYMSPVRNVNGSSVSTSGCDDLEVVTEVVTLASRRDY